MPKVNAPRRILRLLLAGILLSSAAFANFVSLGPGQGFGCDVNQVMLTGSATAFCVNANGYTDGWSPTAVPTGINLFGSNAQFIAYTFVGGGGGGGWLNGDVEGSATGSAFSVQTALNQVGPDEANSTITDGTVSVGINSKVINNNLKQTLTITNNGPNVINSITMGDMFHYYPHGSTNPSIGTLYFEFVPTIEDTIVLGLWARDPVWVPGLVREGGMCGGFGTTCTTPDGYIIDTFGNVFGAVNGLASAQLPGGATSGTLDVAGALSWTQSVNLGQGDSTTFTTELVPEPRTTAVLMLAGGLLALYRRRLAR
jgi:hypothetical protein